MSLPRLCHQRTLISCQRSIAARNSAGPLTSRSSSRPSSRRRRCRAGPSGACAAVRRGTPRTGREARSRIGSGAAARAAAAPPAQRVSVAEPFARRPAAARAIRRLCVAHRCIATAAVDVTRGQLGQAHAPVVARGAAQLGQDPERPPARQHQRGQAHEPVAVADGHDPRLPAPAQCGHHAPRPLCARRTASPRRRACEQLLPLRKQQASMASRWSSAAHRPRSAAAHYRVRLRGRSMRSDAAGRRADRSAAGPGAGRPRPTRLRCCGRGARSSSRAGAPRTAATKSASSQR